MGNTTWPTAAGAPRRRAAVPGIARSPVAAFAPSPVADPVGRLGHDTFAPA